MSEDEDNKLLFGSPGTELSSNRTALSFQRTRMSADRTLMAIVRTSLSLIGFGFTIFQIFRQAQRTRAFAGMIADDAPAKFALSLLVIGVGLLTSGIVNHYITMKDLSRRRDELFTMEIMHRGSRYRTSPTAIAAVLLLLVGLISIFDIIRRMGLFS